MRADLLRAGAAILAAVLIAGCGGAAHPRSVTAPSPSASTSTEPSTSPPTGVPTASPGTAVGPVVTSRSFGMHYLGFGTHPYPPLPFGTARVWDMGVTWKDLQPSPTSSLTSRGNPTVARLDAIIDTFRRHHVDPVLTLGMTPGWAARSCNHVIRGFDWGTQTCAPRDTSVSGPWGQYVRALATRYKNKVRYFEFWNEPTLHNGYNDALPALAQMQASAHHILQSLGFGQKLVSPSIVFTDGAPTHGLTWLDQFLSLPGGLDFDVVGLHLYPSDGAAKDGTGPEWSVQTALPAARAVLAKHGIGNRPLWNTEMNVGRIPAGITFTGTTAAGMLARAFVLAQQSNIARVIWYGADDQAFGGTPVENGDASSLTAAGTAERFLYALVLGATPRGCAHAEPGPAGGYSCTYTLAGGRQLHVVWATDRSYDLPTPPGTVRAFTVTGKRIRIRSSIRIGPVPVYIVGSA